MEDKHQESLQVVSSDVEEKFEIAPIENRVAIAMRFPRELATIRNRVLELACIDQETAEACFYALPTGDKIIEGPGIRLAEIIKSIWGHLSTSSKPGIIDKNGMTVTAYGLCYDYQTNSDAMVEETMSIKDSRGNIFSHHMIITTMKACQAKAERKAIFKILPMAYFKSTIDDIKRYAIGESNGESLAQRIEKAMHYFKVAGVSVERILSVMEVKETAQLNEEHLAQLTGIKTAIKEGRVTFSEAFPETAKERNNSRVNKTINDLKR